MKSSFAALLASASVAAAHMEMTWPPPFRSKYNPFANPATIDYTMTAPLLADGSNFPCKNYQTADMGTPSGRPTATFAAGQAANLTLGGGAIHGGGSCQVSLSYDRGHSFVVLQSFEGGCPAAAGSTSLNFAIPFDAPAGEALLAWTWFNRLGNREMYMNCAAVTISGGASNDRKRSTHTPLNARPKLFTANIGNGCTTVDNADLQFPQPGPDVETQGSLTPPMGNGCQTSSGSVAGGTDGGSGGDDSGNNHNQGGDDDADSAAPKPPAAAAEVAPKAHPSGAFVTSPASGGASASSAPKAPAPAAATPAPAAAPKPAPAAAPQAAEVASGDASGATAAGTACSSEGKWACLPGGRSFQRCASGLWSAVQPTAPGTLCRVGQTNNLEIEAAQQDVPRVRQLRRGWRAEEE